MAQNELAFGCGPGGEDWLQAFNDWEVQAIVLNLQEDGDLAELLRTCAQ